MPSSPADQAIECTSSEQIFLDASGGIRSERFDDFYFHPGAGAEESQHVFVDGNNLRYRWHQLAAELPNLRSHHPAPHFSIVELGFGTGLNFLVTLNNWLKQFGSSNIDKTKHPTPVLYYYALEKYPLTPQALSKVLGFYNPFPTLSEILLARYPDPIADNFLLQLTIDNCKINLVLFFGEAEQNLSHLEHYPSRPEDSLKVDAWYLDGFAPSQNPTMWSDALFRRLAQHSHPYGSHRATTTAATFSVARKVRDGLTNAHFNVKKTPGFGKKREMLCAKYAGTYETPIANSQKNNAKHRTKSPRKSRSTNQRFTHCYYRFSPTQKTNKQPGKVLIIGAGIAGCSTANQLARRGCEVTVLDTSDKPASAASGNRAAVLFPRTAKQRSQLSDFHEACYHYALSFYHALASREPAFNTLTNGLSGMVRVAESIASVKKNNAELKSRVELTVDHCLSITGAELAADAVWYPDAGYLIPEIICDALLQHENIEFIGNSSATHIEQLSASDSSQLCQWRANTATNKNYIADAIVLCTGHLTNRDWNLDWLPIKSIRGQCSDIPALDIEAGQPLKVTVCGKGYITPTIGNTHAAGASFNLDEMGTVLNARDHRNNCRQIAASFAKESSWHRYLTEQANSEPTYSGRVGFRATTPDYLPIVGPIAEREKFLRLYQSLTLNAKRSPNATAPLIPGLYVCTGFGSHGFTSAPLASEIIAAQICGEPMPVSDKLRRIISPNRFLLKQLVNQGKYLHK